MNNHVHLLIRPREGTISRIVQSLLVSHTQRYHRLHHSGGHVWQGRFKSPVVQDDDHLLAVLRYVEGSWVARLCRRLKLDLTIRPRGRPRKSAREEKQF